jgi:hypothetical protein
MFLAPVLAFLVMTAAHAAWADDGASGPARWLIEERDDLSFFSAALAPAADADPLSRFVAYCKRNPIGLRPLVTMLPLDVAIDGEAQLPTLAFFVRAQGRAIISLTRVRAGADAGQDVVLQRTLVSDLLAGRRFSLTVYEDHAIGDAAARLMGVGARLTLRPSGWPFRIELLSSYDVDAGASAYLAITGVFGAPPLPVGVRR